MEEEEMGVVCRVSPGPGRVQQTKPEEHEGRQEGRRNRESKTADDQTRGQDVLTFSGRVCT